jgi:hypothetical protein
MHVSGTVALGHPALGINGDVRKVIHASTHFLCNSTGGDFLVHSLAMS